MDYMNKNFLRTSHNITAEFWKANWDTCLIRILAGKEIVVWSVF